MHRFFISPEWIQRGRVTITDARVHQLCHVLRLQAGDHIVVLDNTGWEYEVELTCLERSLVEGEVRKKSLAIGEPRTKITLYQGVLKARRFEYVLQKGTELGLVEFVPTICEHCVISNLNDIEKKYGRWEWLVLEAAEQSHRGRLPVLQPAMLLSDACERARMSGGLSLLFWEQPSGRSLKALLRSGSGNSAAPFSINLFVGPEGGFSPAEVEAAEHYGLRTITLGPRILRAETAGLVAAAAILYELGDLE